MIPKTLQSDREQCAQDAKPVRKNQKNFAQLKLNKLGRFGTRNCLVAGHVPAEESVCRLKEAIV